MGTQAGGFRILAVLSVVSLVALAGCRTAPELKEVPELGKTAVLSRMNTQAAKVGGLRARLDVRVQAPGMTHIESMNGYLAAAPPDRLRIRGQHDLANAKFDIGSDGQRWFVHTQGGELNEMHVGSVEALGEEYDPTVPLSPGDVVTALGVGELNERPPDSELFLTRHPGHYQITEIVSNASRRYVSRRLWVEPEAMRITRIETYRPDEGVDMIAEMQFDEAGGSTRAVPVKATIRLLRGEQENHFYLELSLRNRETGPIDPAKAKKLFATPRAEGAEVIRHGE
jgi:hypothetical protein